MDQRPKKAPPFKLTEIQSKMEGWRSKLDEKIRRLTTARNRLSIFLRKVEEENGEIEASYNERRRAINKDFDQKVRTLRSGSSGRNLSSSVQRDLDYLQQNHQEEGNRLEYWRKMEHNHRRNLATIRWSDYSFNEILFSHFIREEEACVMFLDQLTQDCLGKNCIQNVSSFLKFLVESTEKMVQIDREHSNTWNNYHGWHVNWRQCLYVLNETERGVETAFYDWIAAFSQRWNMIGEHKKEINDVRASLKRFLDDYKQRPREEELNSFIVSNDFSSGYDKENEINDGGSLGEPKTFEKSDSTEKSGDAGKLSESASVHEKFDEENYAANNKTSSDNVSEASSWEEIFCCCGDSDGTEHFSDHGGEVLEKFDNLEKMNEDVTKKKGLKFQSDLLKQTPCDSEKVLQNLETTAGEAENIEKPQDPIVFDPMSALQKCEEEVDSAENFMKMAENLCSEYKEAQDYLNLGKRRFDQLIYQKQKASLKEIKDNMTNLMEFVKKMETDFSAENVENAPNNLSDDSMWLSLESSFQHLKKRARNGFSMQEMKRNFP